MNALRREPAWHMTHPGGCFMRVCAKPPFSRFAFGQPYPPFDNMWFALKVGTLVYGG
jgi:hypothetical protein